MGKIKSLIENNFSAILLISIIIGVIFKQPGNLPDYTVMILISIMMFFSCASISGKDIKSINIKYFLLFYIMRFILLPTVLYYISIVLIPEYALGILLIALIPVGVASTALTHIINGNPSFTFVMTVATSAATPFTVPFLIELIAGKEAEINSFSMFITLLFSIFIPAFLYFVFVRKTKGIKKWINCQSKLVAIFAMALVIIILVSSQRHYFFENIETVIFVAIIGCILYAVLYIFGWLYATTMVFTEKKTYALCSGANNLGLAAGIALLYFPPIVILLTIMCEIAWVLSLAIFKKFVDYKEAR